MKGRGLERFAISIALVSATAPSFAVAEAHPVPLQKSDCSMARAGTSLAAGHALFEYTIESSGSVGRIQLLYADVRPPEAQPAFIATLTSCIQGWKFKPATVDGVPAAARMKVAFHSFPPTPAGAERVVLPDGETVPVLLVQQMREATLAYAESLLKGPDTTERQGDGWRLRTDLPGSVLERVQDAVAFAQRALDQTLGGPSPGAGLPAEQREVTLLLFRDMEEYRRVSAFNNLVPESAASLGEYDAQFRLIYAAAGNRPISQFARVMAHEATHHFLAQRFAARRQPLPRWLGEGVAQFIECLKPTQSAMIPLAALDRGDYDQVIARESGGVYVLRKHAEAALLALPVNLGQVDVAALIDGRLDRDFFDEKAENVYNVSWLLVHFLMNGEEGRHREAFRAWVLDAGVKKTAAALASATGIPTTDLPTLLRDYAGKLQ